MDILVLIGPPCSGKSTWANQWIKDKPGWVILNRDSYRSMFKGNPYKFDVGVEKLVTDCLSSDLHHAVEMGFNVVVDNTNCAYGIITDYLKYKPRHEVSYKVFDTPLDVILERNKVRPPATFDTIPEQVIVTMFNKLQELKKSFKFNQFIHLLAHDNKI